MVVGADRATMDPAADATGPSGEGRPGARPVPAAGLVVSETRTGSSVSATGTTVVGDRAAVPVSVGDDPATRRLLLAWDHNVRFTPGFQSTLLTLGEICGQALERTELHDREHAVILELQAQLLAPLPAVPGLECAAVYRPASSTVGMGGDWYNAAAVDGSLVLSIGDVTGHGVGAVAAMARLQSLGHGLARAGRDIREILATMSALIEVEASEFATAQIARVDPRAGKLQYASAGHPYPLLRHPDGRVDQLRGARSPLLGVPCGERTLDEVEFPPGAAVLAYTDGLIERRDVAITDRIDWLAHALHVVDFDRPVAEIVDDLVALSLGGAGTANADDVAVVLVRRTLADA